MLIIVTRKANGHPALISNCADCVHTSRNTPTAKRICGGVVFVHEENKCPDAEHH